MEDNKKDNLPGENDEVLDGHSDAQDGDSREAEMPEADAAESKRTAFPHEGDEFGPDAFEDEPEQPVAASTPAGHDAGNSNVNRLPWFLFAAALVAIAVILYIGQSGGNGLSGAAAKVNGEKITKEDLYNTLYKQGGEAALESMITEKLIAQEVKKQKVSATDAEIDAELAEIKAQFPGDGQFDAALQQNNLTIDTLKQQIRTNQEISKIFEAKMDLSDAKLQEYFDKNKEGFSTPEQIEVSHILVEKKEDADKILADLKGGADFAATAKEKSTDTGTKDSGGSLGFVSRGQGLDQAFEDAAFKLSKGELSGVVQSSFGYHIIKVTDKKAAVNPTFDQKKAEVKKAMVQEEVSSKASAWLEDLKKAATIEKQ